MLLGIIFVVAAIIGFVNGIVKKDKILLAGSIGMLMVIAIIGTIYSYLYAQNPY